MVNFRVLPFLTLTVALLVPQAARSQVAICSDVMAKSLAPERNKIAWVLTARAQVPVFTAVNSANSASTLEFSRNLRALATQGSRVKVEDSTTSAELGWVEMDDLVCNDRPLMVRGRLERKVFIKPPRAVIDQTSAGQRPDFFAAPAPGMKCSRSTPGCAPMQWLGRYFVYAERTVAGVGGRGESWVLLAPLPSLSGTSKVTGWVPKANVVEWSTFFGLHPPTDELVDAKGAPVESFICAFGTKSAALAPPAGTTPPPGCTEISTGPRWAGVNEPLPILDELFEATPEVVRVATVLNENRELTVQPVVPKRESARAMDVVFAIDATMSMDHYIRSVAEEFVPKVTAALANSRNLRFGWVVYRDVGIINPEGMPMESAPFPRECNANSNEDAQARLRTVQASTTDQSIGDDEWEDISDGIGRAVEMLKASSCADHDKVLVVVGDAGGRPGDRKARVAAAVTKLAKLRETSSTYVFFARTPANSDKHGKTQYEEAYRDFNDEAVYLLKSFDGTSKFQSGPLEDLSHEILSATQPDEVVKKIVASLEAYASTSVESDTTRQLQAGVALYQAYENVMRQNRDIPARRFTNSFEANCRALVDNNPEMAARKVALQQANLSESDSYTRICSASTIIAVEEAFVRTRNTPIYYHFRGPGKRLATGVLRPAEDMRIAVRLTNPQLREWISQLHNLIITVNGASNKTQSLIHARAQLIRYILGDDPKWDPKKENIQTFMLRAGGFPVSNASVLLAYTDYLQAAPAGQAEGKMRNQLQDATPDEVNRLVEWLGFSGDLLDTVYKGNRPVFKLESYQDNMLHPVPRGIERRSEEFPKGHGYCRSGEHENQGVCWVPREILP